MACRGGCVNEGAVARGWWRVTSLQEPSSHIALAAVRSGKEATPSRSRQGTTRGRGVSAQDGVPPGVAGSSRAPPGAGTGARSAVEPGRLGRVPAALAATAVEAEAGAAPPTPRTGAVRRVLRRLSVGLMGRDAEAGDGGSQREDGQPEKSGGQGAWHAGRRASVDGQEGGSGGTKARAEGAAEARAERKKERLGGGQLALVADTDRGGMLRTVMSGYAPPRGARYHNRDKDEATADVQGSMIISDEVSVAGWAGSAGINGVGALGRMGPFAPRAGRAWVQHPGTHQPRVNGSGRPSGVPSS